MDCQSDVSADERIGLFSKMRPHCSSLHYLFHLLLPASCLGELKTIQGYIKADP